MQCLGGAGLTIAINDVIAAATTDEIIATAAIYGVFAASCADCVIPGVPENEVGIVAGTIDAFAIAVDIAVVYIVVGAGAVNDVEFGVAGKADWLCG